MKKLLLIVNVILLAVFVSCGQEKPDDTVTGDTAVTPDDTTDTVVIEDSRFDDTEWQNVLAVLQETLEAERANSTPDTVLNAGKALVLAAKFIKENMVTVEYGFTDDDIATYKNYATLKFNTVINHASATAEQKAEAEAELAKISML